MHAGLEISDLGPWRAAGALPARRPRAPAGRMPNGRLARPVPLAPPRASVLPSGGEPDRVSPTLPACSAARCSTCQELTARLPRPARQPRSARASAKWRPRFFILSSSTSTSSSLPHRFSWPGPPPMSRSQRYTPVGETHYNTELPMARGSSSAAGASRALSPAHTAPYAVAPYAASPYSSPSRSPAPPAHAYGAPHPSAGHGYHESSFPSYAGDGFEDESHIPLSEDKSAPLEKVTSSMDVDYPPPPPRHVQYGCVF